MTEQTQVDLFDDRLPTTRENLHAEMQRQWQSADESLPQQTVGLRDICGTWVRVTNIYGPKDLGNGPVYAIDIVDEERSLFETTYVGSKQIVDKLCNPNLATYLEDWRNCMMILVQWHERGDKGYYTAKVWFGDADSGNRPTGSIG